MGVRRSARGSRGGVLGVLELEGGVAGVVGRVGGHGGVVGDGWAW
jgi:hypothetical protein